MRKGILKRGDYDSNACKGGATLGLIGKGCESIKMESLLIQLPSSHELEPVTQSPQGSVFSNL